MGNASNTPSEPIAVEDLVATLHGKYPAVEVQLLREEILQAFESYRAAPVQSFLPILIERQVRPDLHLTRAG